MSITEAIENAQIRVNAVYDKCEEKGATLPETKNLANLPATIDTIPVGGGSGDVVDAYMSGDTLITPTDGSDKQVLLTKVGYQATGSETFSPEVRVSFISENGYAGYTTFEAYPIRPSNSRTTAYDIINGSVDSSTGRKTYTDTTSFYYGYRVIPFFLNNGVVFIEGNSQKDYYGLQRDNAYTVACYNYNTLKKSRSIGSTYGLNVLETGFFSCYSTKIWKIDNDLNETFYDTNMSGSKTTYVIEDDESYYFYYDTATYRKTWTLAKGQVTEGALTVTDIKTDAYETALPFTFVHSEENSNPHILLQCKQRITTDKGFMRFIVHALGYMCFDINNEDETQSVISTHGWSESSLAETIGNRTIYKMQTFYDGTFSLDLSDGTTLMCEFTPSKTVNCLEVVEPFIIDGDTTIYHRTFSERRVYWYQRPEGSATQNYVSLGADAPISSNPYGPYNATKATVDWLAVPRVQNRWNTTVVTGVIRQEEQMNDPIYDETGRRVIKVETAIAKI